jgi:hypothetical protein
MITPERAKELRARGFKVDVRQIKRQSQPEQTEQPKEAPKQDDFSKQAINHIMTIAEQSEANMKNIISNNSAIIEVMKEIAKPKPLKKWKCQIGRNSRGEMSTVDINEY